MREGWPILGLNFSGLRVVDVGAGESTWRLLQMGAEVIAVDRDLERLREFARAGVAVVACDFLNVPFRRRFADLTVFHFTLHEVDPARHPEALEAARQVAPMVLIVEPSPEGGPAFLRFYELWREAMESVGRFEEYRPMEYWASLVESCGFEVDLAERVSQDLVVSEEEVATLSREAADLWRRMGVPERIVREMLEFPAYVEEVGGMRWSDLAVVLGRDSASRGRGGRTSER